MTNSKHETPVPTSEQSAKRYQTLIGIISIVLAALNLYKDVGSLVGYILFAMFLALLFPYERTIVSG